MNNLQRTTNILGGGTFNESAQRKLAGPFSEWRLWDTVLANGGFDFNRSDRAKLAPITVPGVVNVSPSDAELQLVGGFYGDDGLNEAFRSVWERPVYRAVDRVVEALQQHRVVGSQTLWHQGMRSGHHGVTEAGLLRLHERVPDMVIVVRTVIPEDPIERETALRGQALFADLQRRGVISATLVTDNAGPFAVRYKLDEQDKFDATAITAFLAGNAMFLRVRNLAEMTRAIGTFSPFAGLAFASRQVETVKTWVTPWRRTRAEMVRTRYGEVSLRHVLHEATLAIETVLHDRTARAIDADIDLATPCYLSMTMPITPAAKDAWEFLASELRRHLKKTYPMVVPMFASGSGTPDARYHGIWWIQASACFPLPPVLPLKITPVRRTASTLAAPIQPIVPRPGANGATPPAPEYIPQ